MSTTFTPPLEALTTVFTPPCLTTWLLTTTKVPSQCPPFPTTGASGCDPPSWSSYLAGCGFEYYSPAICPSGFGVGPSCVVSKPRTSEGFQPIESGETAAYCVPSGHTCTSDTTDFRGGVWGVLRTASASGAAVTVGPAIQIRWRNEDLSILETDPLTFGLRPVRSTSREEPQILVSTLPTAVTAPFTYQPIRATTDSLTGSSPLPSTSNTLNTELTTGIKTPPTNTGESLSPSESEMASGDQISDQDEGDNRTDSSRFSVAAIVLTAILISMIQGYMAFLFIRRYRRYRAGEVDTLFPTALDTMVRRYAGNRVRPRVSDKMETGRWPKNPDAELGAEGPLPELGPGAPLGTRENPAELANTERWSWMSRVSKVMFSAQMKKASWPR
ncbi:hypothetical protein F5X99DRAFT_172616 [Biscogniauxia marginata]|nr:hypothetical protein F5X99DRAFT_172616 [Biscogniauxia marginata]